MHRKAFRSHIEWFFYESDNIEKERYLNNASPDLHRYVCAVIMIYWRSAKAIDCQPGKLSSGADTFRPLSVGHWDSFQFSRVQHHMLDPFAMPGIDNMDQPIGSLDHGRVGKLVARLVFVVQN